jgi:phosphoserine phosphatase RsbU/P
MLVEQAPENYRLACLELRGGNELAEYSAKVPGLACWVSCRPHGPSSRGGDLYYLSACSHGDIARVVLADVSGHGDTVSSPARHLHDALQQHIDDWDQSALIRQLNDSFFHSTPKNRFATAFLSSFYANTGEMLFTNAGQVPPLWFRAAAKEWSLLSDSTPLSKEIVDLPLGMIAGTEYRQTAVQLEPGDLLLLFTDGINESFDESGEQLGLDGLLSRAGDLPTESALAAGVGLRALASEFRGGAPATDDETIVALRRPVEGA